jgi:hypothetical protein
MTRVAERRSPLFRKIPRLAVFLAASSVALAQTGAIGESDLTGIYQSISGSTVLPGGLKNSGAPGEIPLTVAARDQIKAIDIRTDPGRICLPLGIFRMMAEDRVKIELDPGPGYWIMLFEDASHGHIRTIYTKREHPQKIEPSWFGDSVGHWDKSTFVIDTVGLNVSTWLNEAGAQHSEQLHLVERIRPAVKGKYLEYKMTAEDPKFLNKPYTYVRYFEKKLATDISEDFCEAEFPPGVGKP